MPDIDPLSQLIGAQTAQLSELSRQLTDIRSEVVTNRSFSQTRWDDFAHKLDIVQAEYRNVKHDYRNFEQAKEGISSVLKNLERRIHEMEETLKTWKIKIGVVMVISSGLGAFVVAIVAPLIAELINRWFAR